MDVLSDNMHINKAKKLFCKSGIKLLLVFILITHFFSFLFSYTPFNRNPILIFPSENGAVSSELEERNQRDPSFIKLGPDGNLNILVGSRYTKVTPNGEILVEDKEIFEPLGLNGTYYNSYVVDYNNNLHIAVNAYDSIPDTVYHYYSNGDWEVEIMYQRKTYYVKLDDNGDPIPGMPPFIINRDYDMGYNLDLILGYDGYLHLIERSSLADIYGYGDDNNIYYSRLTTNGDVIVNFQAVLGEPQSYSFDGMELLQDSEGYLQFVWSSLYGTPWYRFDTNGNLDNYIYFGPPDYSPFFSFFSLPDEPYDLLILFEVGPPDYTVFYNIYPDGTMIDQTYIPYPDELYGGIDGDGGWLTDFIDNQGNIHNMFRRTIYFEDQEPDTKYFYQKLSYNGEYIVSPFEENIMTQFGNPPKEIATDQNGFPIFIISQFQINDIYFAWFDPDSVRIEFGENTDLTDSTFYVPLVINCDQWENLLPIKELNFDIYYDPERLELADVVLSEESQLMGIHAWANDENGSIEFTISDTSGLVIHSGGDPVVELWFNHVAEEGDAEPVILKRIHTAVDTLNFQLDHQTTIQSLSGGMFGDVNNDLSVNVLDIINLVNFIIDNEQPTPLQFWAADFNRDEVLNVLDIIQIINTILEE